jgi:hypothetical protein
MSSLYMNDNLWVDRCDLTVYMMRGRKAARCMLCNMLVRTQLSAAHPRLQVAAAWLTAEKGAAAGCRGDGMMVATAMASVFIIITVAGRETGWPPMARATDCCRRTDFSEGRGHR